MRFIEQINNIKKRIITKIAINKIIKFIKKSHINAYTVGNEIIYIYSLLYHLYKDNNGNYDIDNNFYNYLIEQNTFKNAYLNDFLSKNILYSEFFINLNIKIFKLKSKYIWNYLRGYFVNDFEFLVFHINKYNTSYCIIYDYHPHYITFIYEFLKKIYINNIDMNLELNNNNDIYSPDNETKNTNYKLIINHIPSDFNNPILDLLTLFYSNIYDVNEIRDTADIKLYQQYQYYQYYI